MTGRAPDPSNRCLKPAEWPAPERALWAAAVQPGTAPDQTSIAAHWSEATRHMVAGGYGRWLTWLAMQGLLEPLMSPTARVTPEQVARYRVDLQATVGAFTVAARIEQLGNAMRVLAPDRPWQWLQQIASQVRTGAKADRRPEPVDLPLLACLEDKVAAPPAAGDPTLSNQSLKLAAWPAPDRAAWQAALQPGDVLDPGGTAATWAPATRTVVVDGYGHWLAWLARTGALDPQLPPQQRATRPRLLAYTRHLEVTVASFTVAARVEQLGNALRALAPDADWRWIQRAANRIRAQAVPVRDKRARLQSPDRLAAFGLALMQQADDPANGSPVVRAAAFRDGLLIALLAHRPMRARNLASILCDRHLVRRGTDWWLVFPPAETKTHQALEFSFPAELVSNLQRYLELHRPVLLARGARQATPPTGLWISKQGTQMGCAAISHQVRDRTAAAFARPLSPHLFRDCAATEIAISAPEHVRIITSILGHATLATSERHYNLAGSLQAGRRYAATIAELRSPKPCAPSG